MNNLKSTKILILLSFVFSNILFSNGNCKKYDKNSCQEKASCYWDSNNNVCLNYTIDQIYKINNDKVLEKVISLDNEYEQTSINEIGIVSFKNLDEIIDSNPFTYCEYCNSGTKINYYNNGELVKEIEYWDQYIYKIHNYKNGKLNGIQIQCNFDHEHHHPFKYSIYKIENYKSGKRNGEFHEYLNDNLQTHLLYNYKNDLKDGMFFKVYESYMQPDTILKGKFKNNLKYGKWTYVWGNDSNEFPLDIGYYNESGKLHKVQISDGDIIFEGLVKDSNIDTSFSIGRLNMFIGKYSDWEFTSTDTCTFYYPQSNQILCKGIVDIAKGMHHITYIYIENRRNYETELINFIKKFKQKGKWDYYYENGNIKKEEYFSNDGKPKGNWISYDINGKIID